MCYAGLEKNRSPSSFYLSLAAACQPFLSVDWLRTESRTDIFVPAAQQQHNARLFILSCAYVCLSGCFFPPLLLLLFSYTFLLI